VTVVTITNTLPVVTVTDGGERITVTPPPEVRVDLGVNPPVFNLTGHSIFAKAGTGGVNGFQVVYIASDGTARPADGTNQTHAGKVIGLTTAAQSEGEPATVQIAGEIENPAWNLTPGGVYFLVAGGEISHSPPESGFVQKIGVAKSATVLVISLGETTLR
jgi:hypothetical protein